MEPVVARPRGRPKGTVAPCRHCGKNFKRMEHLLRHERTHTQEKPFVCDCGKKFSRQDLLARHTRLSHASGPSDLPVQAGAEEVPTAPDETFQGLTDFEFFWDPDFMSQEMLPVAAGVYDNAFELEETASDLRAPKECNITRFSSRLPNLDDAEDYAEDAGSDEAREGSDSAAPVPWSIPKVVYEQLRTEIQTYSAVLPPGYSLPSRALLSRHLEVYLSCVQEFIPFIHVPTFSVGATNADLLLAMTAFGALYKFEHAQANELYIMSKSIVLEKTRRDHLQLASDLLSRQDSSSAKQTGLDRAQTFILLLSFSSWGDRKLLQDGLSIASQLATLVRELGISKPAEMPQNPTWLQWVEVEGRRRTLLAAYALFNLHTIAYDVPPLILNHEVGTSLPGYAEAWRAENEIEWHKSAHPVELQFQDGLRRMLDGTGNSEEGSVSAFANYVLMLGMIQRIYLTRQGSFGPLSPDVNEAFEKALHSWQASWNLTHESSLDPFSAKGPFGLTATSLLRLAYIRLLPVQTPYRYFLTGDLRNLTAQTASLNRSSQVDKAVLHAAHALSVPVRLGIAYMSCSKTPIWTIEHSLSSLECALLLKDWLEMISAFVLPSGANGLRPPEVQLLGLVTSIIKETHFADTLDVVEDDDHHIRRMAVTVLRIWAEMFSGGHVLEIDTLIGVGLQHLADATLG